MTDNSDMATDDMPEVKRESLDMTKHNFYTLLGVPKGSNISRIRAGFHKQCLRLHPDHFYPSYAMEVADGDDENEDTEEKEHPEAKEARLRFEALAVGFVVLKCEERKRIYDTLGYEALVRSEEYQTESSLDVDPYEVYDDFWNGKDPKDKEYLFLNGPNVDWSDDELEEEDEEQEKQQEEQNKEQQEEQVEEEVEESNCSSSSTRADGNTDTAMEVTQENATASSSSANSAAAAATNSKQKQKQKFVSKKNTSKNMDVDEEHDEDELEDLAVLSAAMRNKNNLSKDTSSVMSAPKHVIFESMPRPPPHMAATMPISMLSTRPDRSDPVNSDVWKQLAAIANENLKNDKDTAESDDDDESEEEGNDEEEEGDDDDDDEEEEEEEEIGQKD